MAGKVYYISDTHFGHSWMAHHRGFKSVEEHDWHILSSIMETVGKKDTLWILGDITMERSNYGMLGHLTSRGIYLKVVLGNHDKPAHVPKLLEQVNCVCGVSSVEYNGRRIWLTHMPCDSTDLTKFDEYNMHGHIHEVDSPTDRHCNVSAEYINYKPKTVQELFKDKLINII